LGPQAKIIFANTNGKGLRYTQIAMFKSLPLTIREVKATEAVLNRVYDAAKLGLKGDNLALAAGLLPSEYRRLRELDPIAELAEQKGRADGEIAMSTVLHEAAMNGDSKAALEILRHAHGWVAKQQVQIDVAQQISITAALEQAQSRVLELVHEVTDARAPLDGQALESGNSERP
jgi:hypothetical protein